MPPPPAVHTLQGHDEYRLYCLFLHLQIDKQNVENSHTRSCANETVRSFFWHKEKCEKWQEKKELVETSNTKWWITSYLEENLLKYCTHTPKFKTSHSQFLLVLCGCFGWGRDGDGHTQVLRLLLLLCSALLEGVAFCGDGFAARFVGGCLCGGCAHFSTGGAWLCVCGRKGDVKRCECGWVWFVCGWVVSEVWLFCELRWESDYAEVCESEHV